VEDSILLHKILSARIVIYRTGFFIIKVYRAMKRESVYDLKKRGFR